ncbi:MAG: TraX family protein [Oscillospiraceae bacterium]
MDDTPCLRSKTDGLSACAVKYIAVLAMLTDHIAWCFVDTYSPLGEIMHIIGRITAPVMTFFIAEGFYYTKNANKYLLRLGVFAVISYFPYIYMEYGTFYHVTGKGLGLIDYLPRQGVIYTLCLAVLALKTVHSEKLHDAVKCMIVILLCIAALIGDWMFFPVIWAVLFDRYRGSFKDQAAAFAVSSVIMVGAYLAYCGFEFADMFQYGVLLALIPLHFYNGKRGKILGEKADKWFFYIFYPLHMLILGFIKYYFI